MRNKPLTEIGGPIMDYPPHNQRFPRLFEVITKIHCVFYPFGQRRRAYRASERLLVDPRRVV